MMDELISQSFLLPPSPPSQLLCTTGHQVVEFLSQDQWLFDDIVVSKNEARELCPSETILPGNSQIPELSPAQPPSPHRLIKRRGRKPGSSRPNGAHNVSHVQAERQRRDKLNRRFCDLRAAVPTVSRMDKASLLADAVTYIAELRSRVARLEDDINKAVAAKFEQSAAGSSHGTATLLQVDEAVEVRMMGRGAAVVRLTTAASHAPARLMGALRSLDLQVQQACVIRVQGMTLQDVLVDVPAGMHDGDVLRSALLQRLQDSTYPAS